MSVFKFKKFDIDQNGCAQKVGTDSMVLGAFVEHKDPKKILDIGTGNGVLALMMAQKFEDAQITGVEIQRNCAELAQANFNKSQFKDHLSVLNADVNDCEFSNKFDLMISNPPFFDNAMASSRVERTTARHQTSLKLDQLLNIAADHLILNGAIWLIVPRETCENLIEKSSKIGLKLSRRVKVFGKPTFHKRDILCFLKTKKDVKCLQEVFTIRTVNGEYTDEYKVKTIDFHHTRL